MKKLLLVLAILLALLLAAAPAVVGWIARDQLEAQLRLLELESTLWQLEEIEHDAGWLRSSSYWQLRYTGEDRWRGSRLVARHSWRHLWAGDAGSGSAWALLATLTEGTFEIPNQPVLAWQSQAELGYGLGLNANLSWNAHRAELDTLGWVLAPGQLTLSGALNDSPWQLGLAAGPGELRQVDEITRWQGAQLDLQADFFSSIQAELMLEGLAARTISAGRLELSWHGARNAEQLWRHRFEVDTDEATVAGLDHLRMRSALAVDRVDGEAVAAMAQAFSDIGRAGLARQDSRNAQLAVLLQYLPAILQNRPSVQELHVEADSDQGSLLADGRLDLDQASDLQLASPLLLEQAVKMELELSISESLLRWGLVQRYQRRAGQWHQGANDRVLYERLADDQIATWLERGWLERDGQRLHTELDLARGGWLVNQQPWMRRP